MRAFVTMRNYIATTTTVTAELAEIRAKLALLERNDEENAEAVNDRRHLRSHCGPLGEAAAGSLLSPSHRLQKVGGRRLSI